MPYNISKGVVNRSKRYLDDMVTNRRTITWPTHRPEKLAYQIREAIFAATKHPEFSIYHNLHSWFKIKNQGGWVEAEYVGPPLDIPVTRVPEHMTIGEVTNVGGVVGACIKFAERTDEIYFPKAVLREEHLKALHLWGATQTPPWGIIAHEEEGVTMTRKRDMEDMFLWKPTQKEEDHGDGD